MSEYRTGLVFRQLALVPFPDSSDFERCLKSKIEKSQTKQKRSIAINQSELVAFG